MGVMGPSMRGRARDGREDAAPARRRERARRGLRDGRVHAPLRARPSASPGSWSASTPRRRCSSARTGARATGANVAFVRGDAGKLPFRKGSFDAVSCFAALYLIDEPMQAIDELVRVLAPGGRIALMASGVSPGPTPRRRRPARPVRALSGVRIFGRDDLTDALRARGIVEVRRRATASRSSSPAASLPASGACADRRQRCDDDLLEHGAGSAARRRLILVGSRPWKRPISCHGRR